MKKILAQSSLLISLLLLGTTLFSIAYCSYDSSVANLLYKRENEEFDVSLAKIKSLDEFKSVIRSEVNRKNLYSFEIAALIDDRVRKKFHHGVAIIKPCENWFSYFSSKLITASGLNGGVLKPALLPEDIVRSAGAVCSQQAIVFQELVRDFQMEYGSVRFNVPGHKHLASGTKIEGKWYYFDPHLEAVYNSMKPPLLKHIIEGNKEVLNKLYGPESGSVFSMTLHYSVMPWVEGAKDNLIELTEVNQHPEPVLASYHFFSKLISGWGWLFFLLLSISLNFSKKR